MQRGIWVTCWLFDRCAKACQQHISKYSLPPEASAGLGLVHVSPLSVRIFQSASMLQLELQAVVWHQRSADSWLWCMSL